MGYAYYPGANLLHTVTGSDSQAYAVSTLYEPSGKMGRIDHGNGTSTIHTYDPLSTRLTQITTRDPSLLPENDIQRRAYTYYGSVRGDVRAESV